MANYIRMTEDQYEEALSEAFDAGFQEGRQQGYQDGYGSARDKWAPDSVMGSD